MENQAISGGQDNIITFPLQHRSKPARGALKLEVSTSTPVVAAGTEFSIFVVIRNPFPVPVKIYSTRTHIPVELSDEIWRKEQNERVIFERNLLISRTPQNFRRFLLRIGYWITDILKSVNKETGPRIAVAVSTDEKEERAKATPVYVYGDVDTSGGDFVGRDRLNISFVNMQDEEVRQSLIELEEFQAGRNTILLRPGDSVVNHFVIKTTKWLLFTPISHTFQIQVRYEVDGEDHLDTVPYTLNIRASTGSTMVGAVVGGVLGSIVTNLNKSVNMQDFIRNIFISVIFAIVVVIAFARKSNVQQIVSVEDFWGGVFIGFLVGYTGESFIKNIITVSGSPIPIK